ncbi:hypothetical protein [Variovorax sp. Sphag1AA]|uniref:hypothetical protein n=1 Tax=Variovorax sp. Sphag1AA TaxID=2587027 RepID=UPI00160C59D8|nr:hypothetical protein [Variovorax sp. Sphag1AA]MBB3179148.1 hypothetical protein [Variovorax sp. Sphag1AA]
MTPSLIAALFFTVALLVITTYFIFGSVPLLILKHDTPMDSRFVQGFFDTYYRIAMFTAGATAVSYVLAGRLAFAAEAAALAVLAFGLRRTVITKMNAVRAQMQVDETGAIRTFRQVHIAAISINLVQLVLIVWTLIAVSMAQR